MNRQSAVCGALLVVGAMNVRTPQVAPDRLDRLIRLAELDGAVRYFHPEVVSGRANWDSLFASTLVEISAESDARALRALLARIDNAATFVTSGERDTWMASAGDSTVVLKPGARHITVSTLRPLAAKSAAIVVDLRGRTDAPADSILAAIAVAGTATAPAIRSVTYDGFAAAGGVTTARYVIRTRRIPGEKFTGSARPTLRVAFLADERSVLPPVALALRAQGRAFVVTTGVKDVAVASGSYRIPYGAFTVSVRTGDRAGIDGARIAADTVVQSGTLAVGVTADFVRRTTKTVSLAETPIDTLELVRPLATPAFAEWNAAMPSTGLRLLAAFRLWNTIHYFAPYKHLIGNDWNRELRAALPQVEGARDSIDYYKAITAFASKLNDSHVNTGSRAFGAIYGSAQPGVRVRFIENQLVVVQLPIDSVAVRTGLKVGDAIVRVDGERIEDRVRRLSPYVASSTPQNLQRRLPSLILNGSDGSFAKLTVRGVSGAERIVDVPRSLSFATVLNAKSRSGTSLFRTLPGNIGYVDLDRLTPDVVDSMFATLRNTRAIIFDMRGYPLGTTQFIVPRIALRDSTVMSVFRRLIVASPDTAQTTAFRFTQSVPSSRTDARYSGQTVLLIDERAISQAENLGISFRAANGAKFIGSGTAGANGDVTNVPLPGGINVTFTGHDVRHADESQLQRVGLVPDIRATPTIAGIRAGRDEVLETAFRYLGGSGEIPVDTGNDRLPVRARPIVSLLASLPRESPADQWNGTTSTARVGLDETIAHSGTRSGHITAPAVPAAGFSNMTQSVNAAGYAGKRVRYTAYIRGVVDDSTRGFGALAYLRVFQDKFVLASQTAVVEASREWIRTELVFDVPVGAFGMQVGLSLKGVGEAWIDDVSLEVVGPDVPLKGGVEVQPTSTDPINLERAKGAYQIHSGKLENVDFERRRGG